MKRLLEMPVVTFHVADLVSAGPPRRGLKLDDDNCSGRGRLFVMIVDAGDRDFQHRADASTRAVAMDGRTAQADDRTGELHLGALDPSAFTDESRSRQFAKTERTAEPGKR